MKNYSINHQLFNILLASFFLFSCNGSDKDIDPDDPIEEMNEVTTLVPSLTANDGLSVDKNGNIYASNFGVFSTAGGSGTKVLKITPDGNVSDFVNGLDGPVGNAFDSNGNFYIVNGNNGSRGEVLKIDPDGNRTSIATIDGWPLGIVIDNEDNLFVANYHKPTVTKISNEGIVSTFAEDNRLEGCAGIAIDENGNLLLGNYNNGQILKINKSSSVTTIATISGVVSGFGIGYITYFDGIIYATGIGNHKIYKVSLEGDVEVFAGNGQNRRVDGALLQASFRNPNGITIDKTNRILYILDWGQNALRKIDL